MPKKTSSKSTTKKVAAKKVAAKKAVKKVAAKKAPAKKAPAKKAVKRKVPVAKKAVAATKPAAPASTTVIARVDVGFGNDLYIRGEGAGLSWDKGSLMENTSAYEWTFSAEAAKGDFSFKFLINDESWAEGEDLTVAAGGESISSPSFGA